MKTTYKHFVITRFNLPAFPKDKNGKETLTDSWMEERFTLFEKYCIPSIVNQTVTNFEWLVLFDIKTINQFKKKIDFYSNSIAFFTPVYIEDLTKISSYIKSKLTDEDDWLITTRIDNDDSIHKDFVSDIQILFKSHLKDCFFRYNYGYQWNTQTQCLLKFYEQYGNHFLSRIENIKRGVETVFSCENTNIDFLKNVEVVDIDDKKQRLWIEVVHNTNVANHSRVLLPVFCKKKLEPFYVDVVINKKESLKMIYRFLKTQMYNLGAALFEKIGLFNFYKSCIKWFK